MLIEALVAFAGGALTLFSPCSALLLPAFFAYAFAEPGRIVVRTGIFSLGLLSLLVPLGIGAGALGGVLVTRRAELTLVAGLVLVVIGVYQLAVGGFRLPGVDRLAQRSAALTGESALSTYLLGAVYGFGGFCAGPILGGVLTIAASSGGAAPAAALLTAYGAGMMVPLLVMALAWRRLEAPLRRGLVRRDIVLAGLRRPLTTVVSSLLFIGLGIVFAVSQGANALAPLYAALDADSFLLAAESAVRRALTAVPAAGWAATAGALLLLAVGWWAVRRLHRAEPPQ